MIRVRVGEIASSGARAILRPVAADGSAVTPAMRRLDVAAGEELGAQFARLGELPVGSAAITGGGALAAELVVHVVVRSSEEDVTRDGVRRGLVNGLRRLRELEIDDAALAPLGTGAGNLDAEDAAALMVPLLLEHADRGGFPSDITVFVDTDYERDCFEAALARLAP